MSSRIQELCKKLFGNYLKSKLPYLPRKLHSLPPLKIPVNNLPGNRVTLSYAFEGEQAPKILRTRYDKKFKQEISLDEIKIHLEESDVPLYQTSTIKYFDKEKNQFVPIPKSGLIPVNDTNINLQLTKSQTPSTTLGPGWSFDPNVGLVYDMLDPYLRFNYEAAGQQETRSYVTEINTIGPKIDLSFRCQLSFILNTPYELLQKYKPIEVESGFDLVIFWLSFTYIKLKNTPSRVILVGVPLGAAFGLSLIRSGILTPNAR